MYRKFMYFVLSIPRDYWYDQWLETGDDCYLDRYFKYADRALKYTTLKDY